MTLYYQDELVTLYHGNSLEILPTLDIEANVLLTDPPYFKVKKDAWDNQWGKADQFLGWMGEWLDLTKPLLTANASIWVFASPAMTTAVERVVGERFRVLNSIRWAKPGGDNLRRASLPAMRSFVSIWEGIVFAEQCEDEYNEAAKALRRQVFTPLGDYFRLEWERAGWKPGAIGIALGYDPALPARWVEAASLPTMEAYQRLRDLLNADGGDHMRREYSDLRAESDRLLASFEEAKEEILHIRRPFQITKRKLSEDIWHFPSVSKYPGKHPCEKPQAMLRHMIEASSRPGDLILDAFAGSGSTLDAARQLGRRAVGIEQDEQWCEHAANRLSRGTLELEWTA